MDRVGMGTYYLNEAAKLDRPMNCEVGIRGETKEWGIVRGFKYMDECGNAKGWRVQSLERVPSCLHGELQLKREDVRLAFIG